MRMQCTEDEAIICHQNLEGEIRDLVLVALGSQAEVETQLDNDQ